MNTERSFLLDEVAEVRNITTHLHQLARLGTSGTVLLFPHTRSWLVQMLIHLRLFLISWMRMPSMLQVTFFVITLLPSSVGGTTFFGVPQGKSGPLGTNRKKKKV